MNSTIAISSVLNILTTVDVPPLVYIMVLGVLPLVYKLYNLILQDYRFFVSLGPGGTPSTPAGYARICVLRIIARGDVLVPPEPLREPSTLKPFFRSLDDIPSRQMSRPKVAGIAPHRQMTQRSSRAEVMALRQAILTLESHNKGLLKTGKSCFEKHSMALFLAPAGAPVPKGLHQVSAASAEPYRGSEARTVTCGAPPEIAHLHGVDGSLHLTLHPSDAKVVIEKGWGERHPLAGRGSFVPKGFTLIYAPRRPEELDVVVSIMRAGGWWVGGINIQS